MPRRRIGQESFGFGAEERRTKLDALHDLIDWGQLDALLGGVYAAERGEAAWPPLALFKALLLAVWHDLSDVKLAEALEDRSSFRRFCGLSRSSRRRSGPPSSASAASWSRTGSTGRCSVR